MKRNTFIHLTSLLVCCLVLLTACGTTRISSSSLRLLEPSEEQEVLYLYGFVQNSGRYYACVLPVYRQDPDEKDVYHIPLAKELSAAFQQDGWVGAWSPKQYFRDRELAQAYANGHITPGAEFEYHINAEGHMDVLQEKNYYRDD